MKSFSISVQYGQIIVFDPSEPGLGLLWSQEEVDQGFAWDPKMVAFGVPDHDGDCVIHIATYEEFDALDPNALWAVRTPFQVTSPEIAVGTILLDEPFEIAKGNYEIYFQAMQGPGAYAYLFEIHFIKSSNPEFAILKTGPGASSSKVLRTRSRRA
jgi:hypothetical protein